ncbi:MAG: fumarate hydratase [Sphaerochaetaceae bacterium]|nr:fumarate hydratase [Sphaerochaetaceae bacterium]
MELNKSIENALIDAVRILPEDVERVIRKALETEKDSRGRLVLEKIVQNIDVAASSALPLCQDCGMFYVWVEVGDRARFNIAALEEEIYKGCESAAQKAFYRKSIVTEPVFERENSQTNLPPVINYELKKGSSDIILHFLLKGFGSENCSSVRMINPTAGEEGVVNAVLDMMKKAGGKPCPPVFLGVGVGGTMDRAAQLSKKALIREAGSYNPDPRYRAMEERLLKEINAVNIGPGGLGGENTCLSIAVESAPTHIAGLPVALSVNCWADRKASVRILGGYDGNTAPTV